MFENDWYESPTQPWSQIVCQKREAFKQQIRARQIDSYKNSIRQKFNLIINYADPVASVAHIKSAIAKQQHQISYVIDIISGLMDNYHMCIQLAQQRAIETILVHLLQTRPSSTNRHTEEIQNQQLFIGVWIQLVLATTKNWPQLWRAMYQESIAIFWAIACENANDYEICSNVHKLLRFCSTRLNIESSPNDEDLIFLLSLPRISPPILLSIGEHLTLKRQQSKRQTTTISQRNARSTWTKVRSIAAPTSSCFRGWDS